MRRKTQRRRASITSLIDVIFLLLLFFMLASTFTRYAEVEVTAASSGSASNASKSTTVTVFVAPDAIRIEEDIVDETDLAAFLNNTRSGNTLAVSVSVAKDVNTQRLVDILSRLATVPDISLHLLGGDT